MLIFLHRRNQSFVFNMILIFLSSWTININPHRKCQLFGGNCPIPNCLVVNNDAVEFNCSIFNPKAMNPILLHGYFTKQDN